MPENNMENTEVPEVTVGEMHFGTIRYLPDYATLPIEFKNGKTPWNELFTAWFYHGHKKVKSIQVREGLDRNKVVRAICALMASWESKHEHKEAGIAYLMSQWLEGWEKHDS